MQGHFCNFNLLRPGLYLQIPQTRGLYLEFSHFSKCNFWIKEIGQEKVCMREDDIYYSGHYITIVPMLLLHDHTMYEFPGYQHMPKTPMQCPPFYIQFDKSLLIFLFMQR